MIDLGKLGSRICIIGPSNSGKSTLAVWLAGRLGVPAVHLDQLAHVPNSAWQRRPDADFISAHDQVIAEDSWIIEGNYSICMPQRFARATTVIWLDPPRLGCLWRYVLRSLWSSVDRPGGLDGAKHEFSWGLVKFTWVQYPKNKLKYQKILKDFPGQMIHIHSMRALNRQISTWGNEV